VLNKSCGHWLLFDALNAIVSMSLKLKQETRILFRLNDLINDNSVVALECHCLHVTLGEKYVGF
jgi:hypothetical protein